MILRVSDLFTPEIDDLMFKYDKSVADYITDSVFEDGFVKAMEKYNIGTSATRAEIIKKLQNPSRQFIKREDKNGIYRSRRTRSRSATR